MDFDPTLANRYMGCLKDAIGYAIHNGHIKAWFRDNLNDEISLHGASVVELG